MMLTHAPRHNAKPGTNGKAHKEHDHARGKDKADVHAAPNAHALAKRRFLSVVVVIIPVVIVTATAASLSVHCLRPELTSGIVPNGLPIVNHLSTGGK